MIKDKYLKQIKDQVSDFTKNRHVKAFIFGSSLRKEKFSDIDIGLIGDFKTRETMQLKEKIENTTFPFFVDIIDFNKVENSFKNNVLNNDILWIRR